MKWKIWLASIDLLDGSIFHSPIFNNVLIQANANFKVGFFFRKDDPVLLRATLSLNHFFALPLSFQGLLVDMLVLHVIHYLFYCPLLCSFSHFLMVTLALGWCPRALHLVGQQNKYLTHSTD